VNYDELLPDWDAEDLPHRAGLDSRLQAMFLEHLDNDPAYMSTVCGIADDLVNADQVRTALHRVSIAVCNIAIGAYGGRREAIDAFSANLTALRRIALEGVDE
jgi:hypothetical protein